MDLSKEDRNELLFVGFNQDQGEAGPASEAARAA